jgi:copper transport protein
VRRILVTLAAAGLLLGSGVAFAQPAMAHAMVVSAEPAQGADLAKAPASVEITFDEAVGIDGVGYLHVVDGSGRRVDQGAAYHPAGAAAKVVVALRPGLGAGRYTESYRVISADSHPITGAIVFGVGTVGAGSLAQPAAAPDATNAGTSLAFDIARWISFAGLMLLGGGWLGGTVWRAGRRDRRARGLAQGGAWALSLGAIFELLVQGPYDAGTGLSHLTDSALVRDTLRSEFGAAHLWRLALVAALSFVLWSPRRLRSWLTTTLVIPLGVGIAITFAASGHAWAQHPRWLVAGSDTVHVLAMSIWLGGLIHLLAAVLPSRDPDVVRAVLPVYSRVAFGCVVVLAGTGVYQAVRGVVTVDALTHTRYGELVLLKLGLFAVMVALGNASRALVWRRYLQPVAHAKTWAGAAPDNRGPRRTVLIESIVGIAVLVATAVLVAEPPGNVALAGEREQARSASAELGGGRVARVTVSPGTHGPATITISIAGAATPQELTATASLPAQELGPIPVPLTKVGPLTYTSAGVLLPAAGLWTVDLSVQSSTFDATTASVSIRLY